MINNIKLGPHCKSDIDYTAFSLPSKLKSEKRNKIIDVYKNRLNSNEDRNIRKVELYLNKTDYVIIYEYVIKSDDCPSKTLKYIKTFKASSKEKSRQILSKKLETFFTKNRYLSHKILLETQPLIIDESNFLQKSIHLLRENIKRDSLKNTNKAQAIGKRG